MTTPYAEGLPLPDRARDDGASGDGDGTEVDQAEVDQQKAAPPAGGLVQLGSPDGVVCEDGVCWVP